MRLKKIRDGLKNVNASLTQNTFVHQGGCHDGVKPFLRQPSPAFWAF